MGPRRLLAIAAMLPIFAAVGCASTVSGTGELAVPKVSSFPTNAHALGTLLAQGSRSTKSAHLTLQSTTAGTQVVASGAERLANGRLVAMDLTEHIGTVAVRLRLVGSKFYAKLPPEVFPATKPWVQISASTTNPSLQQIYRGTQSTLQSAADENVQVFLRAARNLDFHGTTTFDGVKVGHYSWSVDITALPASFPGRDQLEAGGLTSIPVDFLIDTHGRPRRITEKFAVLGNQVSIRIVLSRIDVPVTITAPPRDQVQVG